jgi:hypothetical protein
MFVSQPEIPVPLVAEFPFPAWATRPDEVGTARPAAPVPPGADGAAPEALDPDPFAGLPGT